MRLTPHKLMTVLRCLGLGIGVAAAIALTGPFRYADLHLPFPDTVAHALLFYGLSVLMLSGLPRSRPLDLALALVGIGAASELAQWMVGRAMSLHDLLADSLGVAAAVLPTLLAQFRALVRSHPHRTLAELRALDRRQGRRPAASRLENAADG